MDLADINELTEKRNNLLQKPKVHILNTQKRQKGYYERKMTNPLGWNPGALVLVEDFTHKKRKGEKLNDKWHSEEVFKRDILFNFAK